MNRIIEGNKCTSLMLRLSVCLKSWLWYLFENETDMKYPSIMSAIFRYISLKVRGKNRFQGPIFSRTKINDSEFENLLKRVIIVDVNSVDPKSSYLILPFSGKSRCRREIIPANEIIPIYFFQGWISLSLTYLTHPWIFVSFVLSVLKELCRWCSFIVLIMSFDDLYNVLKDSKKYYIWYHAVKKPNFAFVNKIDTW